MKKLIYLSLVLTVLLFSCTSKRNTFNIGVILPLTGDGAVYGQGIKKGIDFAYNSLLEENKMKINVIYEDSKMSTKNAISSFEKLSTFDKCSIIIGPFSSSEVLALAPIANKKHVLILSPTATAPSITNSGKYIYRIIPSDEYDGSVMSEFAIKKLKKTNFAILYANNEYGIGMKKSFSDHAKKIGSKIINTFSFENGTTNFKSILNKVKRLKPDAIFIVGGKELGYILKQSKELNFQTQFLSTGMIENNEIMEIAGNSANNVYYSYPSFRVNSKSKLVKNFVNQFNKKTNNNPDVLNALGYDSFMLINKAIRYSKNNIKNYFDNMGIYEGVTGNMKFDRNGDVIKSIGIKMISNNEFIWVIDKFSIN